MNKDIILDLVFSGQRYADSIKIDDAETYTKCREKLEHKIKKLCKKMPKRERDDFLWDITLLQAKIDSVISEEYFKEGFKLGMTIVIQCFLD